MPPLASRHRRTITPHALACLWLLTSWWAVAHAADDVAGSFAHAAKDVAWSFAADVRAGDTVDLTVTGLPDAPGLWIALADVDAPIGAYHDWDYPPMRHDRVLLRLPDAPSTLEFRLYRDAVDRTELLARSAPFLPALQPASLHAPAEVALGSRFAVAWTGPDRAGDAIVLIGPASVGSVGVGPVAVEPRSVDAASLAPALASAPTAAGHPLHLDAPWAPGHYHLRYVTGADRVVLAQVDIDVVDQTAADPTDACHAPPSDASLLAAFDAEVAAALPLARRAYGLDHADYTAAAAVTGSDGSVHASYTVEVVDPVTGERQRITGSATARFSWTGCSWLLVGLTY